jgi:hypothetical protein
LSPWAGTIELAISSKAASASALRRKMLGPRNILIVLAVFELLDVLWDFLFGRRSILFRDRWEPAEPGVADIFAKAYVICHPLLALAALALAAAGRLRHAIVALGALELMRWLNYIPSVVQNGLRLDDGYDIQWTAAQIFVFPVIAACGIALAVRDERPGLATALTGVPTLYNLAGLTVFTLWLLINGL